MLGMKQNLSTAFHPQTDGQTEQMNQPIEEYLRIFINHRQDDWSSWLALAEFTYNNRVHSATKQTPFFLNYGQHPWTGTEGRRESRVENAQQFADRLTTIREDAKSALEFANKVMKENYDKHTRPSRQYKEGDQVYLEATNIKTYRPSKKLSEKRFSPFKILKKIGASAYKLDLPKTWYGIHPVFNESLLSPYIPPKFPSQKKPDPPPAIPVPEGWIEHEVESIKDSRTRRKKVQYLVHWKGYADEHDTWEPLSNLKNALDSLKNFHTTHPNATKDPKLDKLLKQ